MSDDHHTQNTLAICVHYLFLKALQSLVSSDALQICKRLHVQRTGEEGRTSESTIGDQAKIKTASDAFRKALGIDPQIDLFPSGAGEVRLVELFHTGGAAVAEASATNAIPGDVESPNRDGDDWYWVAASAATVLFSAGSLPTAYYLAYSPLLK